MNTPVNREYYDTVSFLECKQEDILNNLIGMEKLSWEMDEKPVDEPFRIKLLNISNDLYHELVHYFTTEEDLLFPQLEQVLPAPSSTAVMRDEHSKILTSINSIIEQLQKQVALENKNKLQSSVMSLVDILQRHIHKKNEVLYYEVQSMIPQESLDEIYRKIVSRYNKSS
jgi:hemerythrin-like domain-containing protein